MKASRFGLNSSKGLVLVPAFSGLYAPHWCNDARGTICGITQFHTKSHIAFAALEAICFQTREVETELVIKSFIRLTFYR